MKSKRSFILIILFSFILYQCSIYQTMTNLSRLQFKVGNINGFKVNNIDITNKSSLKDFSPTDVLTLTSSFSQGKLPVSFVLNVDAKNPNDGTGGYARTDATLKSFKWRLFIDDTETISGDIDSPVTVPGTGEVTKIPLRINIDLFQFFKNQGFDKVINLALTLGGKNSTTSKITLYATPTVSTIFGDIKYPGELKIIDTQFTN
uniref:Late embryogenesis abundant protein LEA-2 subgroup domain-containing protein n=1 Tax=Ignavibacterium album TaxID=591197 RepID=A0A7V3E7W8_9BACT